MNSPPLLLAWTLWCLSLFAPLLCWLPAALLVGPGARFSRSALAFGPAGLALLAWVPFLRLVEALHPGLEGGPLGWIRYMAPGLDPAPLHGVLVFAALDALALLPLVVLATLLLRRRPPRGPFRVPGGALLVWIVLAPLVAGLALAVRPLLRPENDLLLDLLAVLPLSATCFALWALGASRLPKPTPATRPTPPSKPAPTPDVLALWRRLGALNPSANPLVRLPGRAVDGPAGTRGVDDLWRRAGGKGGAPGALESLLGGMELAGGTFHVPDLPDPTERRFLCALLLGTSHEAGIPALVLTEDAALLEEALLRAIREGGGWPRGPVVRGVEALELALEARRMPSVVFLDTEELSTRGIPCLGGASGDRAPAWTGTLGLLVLTRVDRGSPLSLTHRVHALRRLGFVLQAASASCTTVSTGLGGRASLALVENALPGSTPRELPFAPRATARFEAWTPRPEFLVGHGETWIRSVLGPVTAAGARVSVLDPAGACDARALELPGGAALLGRDVLFEGAASVALLDEAWLLAAHRSLVHLAPETDAGSHVALWTLPERPLGRFLARPGVLEGLAARGELPCPRPVVGLSNAGLARAHLHAALREARANPETLAACFGAETLAHASLGSSSGDGCATTLGGGVSDDVIEILDARGASLRRYVDRALLRTRYYPRRVLAVGPRRYEVPSAPPADGARQIRLEEVPPMRPLTVPRLRATARPLGEPQDLHELRSGRLAWRSAFFEAEILEQVDGLRAADGTELVYAPVESVYRSRVRGIFFPSAPPPRVLQHLARALDGVLGALFFLEDDDAHVAAVPAGLPPSLPPGLLVVDRHLGGMGLAEALDDDAVRAALRWVRAVLAACPCANGCARCTPEITLAEGPAKAGVIEVLGG